MCALDVNIYLNLLLLLLSLQCATSISSHLSFYMLPCTICCSLLWVVIHAALDIMMGHSYGEK